MGTTLPAQLIMKTEQLSRIIPTDTATPKDSQVPLTVPEGINHKAIVMP